MYKFEIIKNDGGACIGIGSGRCIEDICETIYEYMCDFAGEESELPLEASSWAELYCGTSTEPAIFEMDDYTLFFWRDE